MLFLVPRVWLFLFFIFVLVRLRAKCILFAKFTTVVDEYKIYIFIISPYSVAFGVILSLLFCLFFVCTVEDISTQDGAIGVKFWPRVEQTSWTGTR